MGFLNPLFLLAGIAVGIPLLLHLFHRQELRRLAFPALRYLQRTEKEHARRIRLRQLLLLLLRIGALLLLVAAGARPFLRSAGSAHPPTAVALVLDNSLSSGRLVGDRRVLDDLKDVAATTLERSGDRDRVWILRAGEPWDVAAPLSPLEARSRVADTDVSAAWGDLDAALERAASLVASSELGAREIHLVSDLQASGFPRADPSLIADVPLVVWSPPPASSSNRALTRVEVGGGLPPIQGQRTQIAAFLAGDSTSNDSVAVRLVVEDQIRGAALVPPNTEVLFPLELAGGGPVTGHVESDPDDLSADDRRHFAFDVRPPPDVRIAGDPGPFVTEALAVLADGSRIRLGSRSATLVVSGGSGGLGNGARAALVFPPADPVLLPALNRALGDAGVPWRYREVEVGGELGVTGVGLPHGLDEVRVHRRYALEPVPGTNQAGTEVATLSSGGAWMVSVVTERGRQLLFGSPMDPTWTSLPVSSVLVPVLEWSLGRWAAAGELDPEIEAGAVLPLPAGATGLGDPDGRLVPLDGGPVRPTRVGVYTAVGASGPVARWVVNPHPRESNLRRLGEDALELRATRLKMAEDTDAWEAAIFDQRQGPEIWRGLLLAALAVLLIESLVASSGRREEHEVRVERRAA